MGPEGPHINLTCLWCLVCVCFPFLWCIIFLFCVVVVVVGCATDPPDNQPKRRSKRQQKRKKLVFQGFWAFLGEGLPTAKPKNKQKQ